MSEKNLAKNRTARRRRRAGPAVAGNDGAGRAHQTRRGSRSRRCAWCSCSCRTAWVRSSGRLPGDGEDYEITPHLKPLEGLKNDFLLLENLWNAKTVGRNGHWPKVPAWLSGGYVERTSGDDLDSGGTSVDQFAAQQIGDRTTLPTFELGLEATRTGIDTAGGGFARMYGSFISWRDPHTPVPKEIIPQLAFDRLFRTNKAPVVSSLNPDDPRCLPRCSATRPASSIWSATGQSRCAQEGSSGDRVRLDEYFESVRCVEQRLQASLKPQKRWINQGKFPLERPGPGIPASRPEHIRLMMDIMVLALWSDTTRIGTFMTADAQTNEDFSFLAGRQGRLAQPLAPRRRAGAQEAVRDVRHLARGAGGLFPEPAEESGRRRDVAARQFDGDVRLRHQVRQPAPGAQSADRARGPRQRHPAPGPARPRSRRKPRFATCTSRCCIAWGSRKHRSATAPDSFRGSADRGLQHRSGWACPGRLSVLPLNSW